jgi:hypothetical protein
MLETSSSSPEPKDEFGIRTIPFPSPEPKHDFGIGTILSLSPEPKHNFGMRTIPSPSPQPKCDFGMGTMPSPSPEPIYDFGMWATCPSPEPEHDFSIRETPFPSPKPMSNFGILATPSPSPEAMCSLLHVEKFGALAISEEAPSPISTHQLTEAKEPFSSSAKEHHEFHITGSYMHLTLVHTGWIWGQLPPSSKSSKQEGQPDTIGEVKSTNELVC